MARPTASRLDVETPPGGAATEIGDGYINNPILGVPTFGPRAHFTIIIIHTYVCMYVCLSVCMYVYIVLPLFSHMLSSFLRTNPMETYARVCPKVERDICPKSTD